MKNYLTFIFVIITSVVFSQDNTQEQLKDSVSNYKLKSFSLIQIMLYPNIESNIFLEPIDNDYSFNPNNSKSLKTMKVVGSTLKVLMENQGIITNKE